MSQSLLGPPATERTETGYLQQSWPVYLILGSFFILTVPLCLLYGSDPDYPFQLSAGLVYVWGLGMTHFLIVLALYFQAANLQHFWSTPANRVFYFVLPAAIFVFFDLYRTLDVAATLPLLDLGLVYVIRLMDFQHSTRQSYGVLQLFRMRSGCRFPTWMGRAENHFFSGLTLLLYVTFLCGGKFRPERPAVPIVLAIVAGLFVWTVAGFVVAWFRSDSRAALAAPLGYFLLQTCAGGLAVYSTPLYGFALAMHYVEYHVLMVPRCFHTPLDESSRADRLFGQVRRHKVLFYGVLLVLAVPVTRFAWQGMNAMFRGDETSLAVPTRVAISVFDGLFVFHYLIESRIWKFRDPYYRRTLIPLYFRSGPPAPTTPDPSTGEPAIREPNRVAVPT